MGFLKDLFHKINFYLDKEIDKADKKSKKFLPKNKIVKQLWKYLFSENKFSKLGKHENSNKFIAKKIVHVVNFIDPDDISNESFKKRCITRKF